MVYSCTLNCANDPNCSHVTTTNSTLRPLTTGPQVGLSNDIVHEKNERCIANIQDISTNPTPLYSSSSSPSSGLHLISLEPLLVELAYLPMVFILELMQTAMSVHQLSNK